MLTLGGLSKTYRLAGFRSGWLVISGPQHEAADYLEGLELLANMRMCANVPAQYAIQTALGGRQSITAAAGARAAGCATSATTPGRRSPRSPA